MHEYLCVAAFPEAADDPFDVDRVQAGAAMRNAPAFMLSHTERDNHARVDSASTCHTQGILGYRTSSPVTARPTSIRWISDVPSKIVKIFASRCQRSTG
jgi:hypothetical protein